MGDGSVRFIKNSIHIRTWRAMSTTQARRSSAPTNFDRRARAAIKGDRFPPAIIVSRSISSFGKPPMAVNLDAKTNLHRPRSKPSP